MGESKRREKRLKDLGAGTHVVVNDIDAAIEDFQKWVESGKIDGFVQLAKVRTTVEGVFQVKMWTMDLEKQEVYDMLCEMKRSMEKAMGFKEDPREDPAPTPVPKDAN